MKANQLFLGAALAASMFSCTNKFEEMNSDPWASDEMNPKYQFTHIQNKPYTDGGESWRTQIIMAGPMSQATGNLYAAGEAFSTSYKEWAWNNIYKDVMKNVADLETNLPAASAQLGQVKITKVIDMLKVLSLYGDIPYTEAGKGYVEHILYPKYDTQKEALEAMVIDLKNGREWVANGETFTDDFYYRGDALKWQKLANSVLMKVALYMSEGDAGRAKEIFTEAFNHSAGYISTLDESAKLEHSLNGGPWGQHMNGVGASMTSQVGGFAYGYISETSLKSMQSRKDPRVFWLTGMHDYSSSPSTMVIPSSDFDPFEMAEEWGSPYKPVSLRGTRMGDQDGQTAVFAVEPNGDVNNASPVNAAYFARMNDGTLKINDKYAIEDGGDKFIFASLNNMTVFNPLSPTIIMGSDEVNFMIAEAIQKNLIGGNAQQFFESGIRDAFDKYNRFYPGIEYVEGAIDAYETTDAGQGFDYNAAKEDYIAAEVMAFASSANKLDNIIYQAWISQIGNGINTFTLWNRTHLPSFVTPELDRNMYETIDIPVYTVDPRDEITAGRPMPEVVGYKTIPFHSPGTTSYVRSRRFDYPNNEMSSNTTNYNEAVERQRAEANGNTGMFNTVDQFLSYKGTFSNSKGVELIKE
ncbi:SusD/RagB family nutrient-binding outer membrane lipoprotein [Flammeovirga sp. OC4]|uniref:SusD/RagB family nutrient-binding outer membrane lipoprotein n=1 Tax=Flammeovirga sp. OC4 TaxID=1382345 RepID=UPI0005C484B2|nr:SusD/RagB family nutrient-binding outer membrane lipoprotein [Flammeovirga sp. OC4]